MTPDKSSQSALKIKGAVEQPPSINPDVFTNNKKRTRRKYSVDEYFEGILGGNRTILSQAITLTESRLSEHDESVQEILEKCLPFSGHSVRIGITGVPGAGKSTFIEAFGLFLTGLGKKPAVLAIDPSSRQSKGSILADKTRMEKLSVHPAAFIRPSPSAGTLGGVAMRTRESIILCEAAGFDTILVETVGVGQSETAVHSMVDFFLLLMLSGAGDEIQGIKRGIMEMADLIAINKADGSNKIAADAARVQYQNALNLFPRAKSGWQPKAVTCSAREGKGIKELWDQICLYNELTKANGFFAERRKEQSVLRMDDTISEFLLASFYRNEGVRSLRLKLIQQLYEGKITSYRAAYKLIDKYLKI